MIGNVLQFHQEKLLQSIKIYDNLLEFDANKDSAEPAVYEGYYGTITGLSTFR